MRGRAQRRDTLRQRHERRGSGHRSEQAEKEAGEETDRYRQLIGHVTSGP